MTPASDYGLWWLVLQEFGERYKKYQEAVHAFIPRLTGKSMLSFNEEL